MRTPAFQLLATASNDNRGSISLFAEPGMRLYRLTHVGEPSLRLQLSCLELMLDASGLRLAQVAPAQALPQPA